MSAAVRGQLLEEPPAEYKRASVSTELAGKWAAHLSRRGGKIALEKLAQGISQGRDPSGLAPNLVSVDAQWLPQAAGPSEAGLYACVLDHWFHRGQWRQPWRAEWLLSLYKAVLEEAPELLSSQFAYGHRMPVTPEGPSAWRFQWLSTGEVFLSAGVVIGDEPAGPLTGARVLADMDAVCPRWRLEHASNWALDAPRALLLATQRDEAFDDMCWANVVSTVMGQVAVLSSSNAAQLVYGAARRGLPREAMQWTSLAEAVARAGVSPKSVVQDGRFDIYERGPQGLYRVLGEQLGKWENSSGPRGAAVRYWVHQLLGARLQVQQTAVPASTVPRL